jgi:hypothetical protein
VKSAGRSKARMSATVSTDQSAPHSIVSRVREYVSPQMARPET